MRVSSTLAGALPTLALATLAAAGPLFPPAGPIASTNKTLREVEPRIAINSTNTPGDADSVFKITQSGSYYLTGNLTGSIDENTLEIEASNVTIDLNGFTINGSTVGNDGIKASLPVDGIVVRNGTIRGHVASGIFLPNARGSTFENLTIASNGSDGLWLGPASTVRNVIIRNHPRNAMNLSSASGSQIIDCIANQNGGGFVESGEDILFRSCSASNNSPGAAFELNSGCKAIDCVASDNATGFVGFGSTVLFENCVATSSTFTGFSSIANSSSFSRCTATGNGTSSISNGFSINNPIGDAELADCVAHVNSGSGFSLNVDRVTLNRCASSGNAGSGVASANKPVRCIDSRFDSNLGTAGLNLGPGSIIDNCSVQKNVGLGIRITGNGNAVIRRSQIVSNQAAGASVGNGSIIEDCLIATNVNEGVIGGVLSIVRRCTFDTNGTAAGNLHPHISFSGGGNLIEDNYIFNGDSGIALSSSGSIVRRNICNGTANNYGLIVGGNRVSTINTSATLNSSNPNDNFSY